MLPLLLILITTASSSSSSSSSSCPAGSYCDVKGVHECGEITHFCPENTNRKIRVRKVRRLPFFLFNTQTHHHHLQHEQQGFFAADKNSHPTTRNAVKQLPCTRGYYCPYVDGHDGQSTGERIPCPQGKYGDREYETSSSCTGNCSEGYWCGEASVSKTQHQCGDHSVYCPTGSYKPLQVPDGYFSGGGTSSTRSSIHICPEGHYCVDGIVHKCGGGVYGATKGLSSSQCSGLCEAGYFCNGTSSTPRQFKCQDSTVYCPEGSSLPTPVSVGYYSLSESISSGMDGSGATREILCPRGEFCINGKRHICEGGLYGATLGLSSSNCTGSCSAGFFCPPKSVSAEERVCGSSSEYCPEGSSEPIPVPLGFYSIDANNDTAIESLDTRVDIRVAEPGHYAKNGIRYECPGGMYGSTEGLSSSQCSGMSFISLSFSLSLSCVRVGETT